MMGIICLFVVIIGFDPTSLLKVVVPKTVEGAFNLAQHLPFHPTFVTILKLADIFALFSQMVK